MSTCVNQDVLWLNVTMTNAFGMNIGNRTQQLIGVKLDQKIRNHLLHFQILLHYTIGRIWNVVHDDVQINFIWFVPVCVERLAHLNAVGVMQHFENCQLAVLVALVLENLFNGHSFACFSNNGLEHHTERTITDNLLRVVCEALLTKLS